MLPEVDWKQRLYDCYVSSGQAGYAAEERSTESRAPVAPTSAAAFLKKHLPRSTQTRIVDLGCGRGALLQALWRAGYHDTLGVDGSAEQIAAAHRSGVLQAQLGTIEEFLANTKDSSVDTVLLMDVLEHMTRDKLFTTLDNVIRILSSGGRCIAHVPNAEGLYGMRVRYGDLTHEQAFTSRSISQLFSATGFSNVTSYEDRPLVHGAKSLIRRALWDFGTVPHRLLLAAETGLIEGFILTQNMFVQAIK
jgi:2-polyprenyl-3-methyl-5-hydroxy-6-metoxy-1,4-benzoquinol methylase